MKIVAGIVGVGCILLGGLWFFQGVGLLRLRPILCFTDCAALQGPSIFWAAIGGMVAILGICFTIYVRRKF
jgi:hypothetical protein